MPDNAPATPANKVPDHVEPKFKVTDKTVTILHGGSNFVYTGHQTTHRVHHDKNGVEHIHWKKKMVPLPNLNVHVVSRGFAAKGR